MRGARGLLGAGVLLAAVSLPGTLLAAAPHGATADPGLFAIPVEFLLFAAMLAAVAVLHRHTLASALIGLLAIVAYKLAVTGFPEGAGLAGLGHHLAAESVGLWNLFLLLLGFALLARHFEESRLPLALPAVLPDDWRGGFALLAIIFVLSGFLDNIAAALIGGTVAQSVFRGRVHIGYLAAIVAAANAGGAGSVVGDTTTTMMWISGVSPLAVLEAYVGGLVALAVFGVAAAFQQQAHQAIVKDPARAVAVDVPRLAIVALILAAAIGANVLSHMFAPGLLDRWPVIGTAVWAALLATAPVRRPDFSVLPEAAKGAFFLLALVIAASMMPVERLPAPTSGTTLGLGFVSAVFDNIPLTALALKQGGYDWGFLAYAVGFGGSMIWFGSSAGVALTTLFPEARSAGGWVRAGWHVAVAYVLGFAAMIAVLGWNP